MHLFGSRDEFGDFYNNSALIFRVMVDFKTQTALIASYVTGEDCSFN